MRDNQTRDILLIRSITAAIHRDVSGILHLYAEARA